MNSPQIRVHPSACKRGLKPAEVQALWKAGVDDTWLDDLDPRRLLRAAHDQAGRPWELVALMFDGGNRHLVIHAMPLRKVTIELLQRRTR